MITRFLIICAVFGLVCVLPAAEETVLLVDYGSTAGGTTFGLNGWHTVFKSGYADYRSYGPGGLTIVTGSNETYNYHGVDGHARYQNASARDYLFKVNDRVRVTWYNNSAGDITFTPRISFNTKGSPSGGGTWLNMTQITVPASGTAVSEYTCDSTWSGYLEYVNINVNYSNNSILVLDKIEWVRNTPNQAAAQTLFDHGTEPLTVNFDGSASTGTIVAYDWDFGDGSTGSGAQVQHTYQGPGVYYPVLTTTDDTSTTDFTTMVITVWPDMTYDFSNLPRGGLQPSGDFLYWGDWSPLYGSEEWEIKVICEHSDGHLGTFSPGDTIRFSSNVGRAEGVESISAKGQASWKVDVELQEMAGEEVNRSFDPSLCAD